MTSVQIIALVIVGGMALAWALHGRSVRRMTPALERLAMDVNGAVKTQGPFMMPKLVFRHSGAQAEVSSASTGVDGESERYTYVLFAGSNYENFEFRIRPRSMQTVGDAWFGRNKPMATGSDTLDARLAVCTNDEPLMQAALPERIKADILSWVGDSGENRLCDIRNYDDKLIYAVTGTLSEYDDYRTLVVSACRFFDVLDKVLSDSART